MARKTSFEIFYEKVSEIEKIWEMETAFKIEPQCIFDGNPTLA